MGLPTEGTKEFNMFKRVLILAMVALLAGLVIGGCSSDDSEAPPAATAKIRVVNASPDGGAIDVYIGTSTTPWLENLEYGKASTYLSRGTGTVNLVIYDAGADPQLLPPYVTESVELAAGASLTCLLAGLVQSGDDADKVRLITYSDNFQNSPTARARVVHATSDAPELTVTIGGTGQVLANNLERWAETGRAGNVYEVGIIQDIVVQAPGNQITSFRAPELEAQKDYYFFLVGLISGNPLIVEPFDLLIVGPGGVLPLETIGVRDIRLVHTSPDLGLVDYYMTYGMGSSFQRQLINGKVEYGDATQYDQRGIRQVIIELYSVGADPDLTAPLFTQAVYIYEEAASTTGFAAGLAASADTEETLRLFSLADDFGVTITGTLPAIVVHACPNLDNLAVDFGHDGSVEAMVDRFAGNTEGATGLPADTKLTMVVADKSGLVDVFTIPNMAEDKQFYLILTGIKGSAPVFSLLSVNQDGSMGFTVPD
jgi:hypothetical protein